MDSNCSTSHRGLSNMSRNSDDVADYYDEWAVDYDQTLAKWRYDAPAQVASMLRAQLPPTSAVLDAGCGTGLSGKALQAVGFTKIDGIDISPRSLKIAGKSGAYRRLQEVDMQQRPLPIETDQYDGLVCVGVLTYLTNSIGTLREFCRVVRSGGILVITQRSDLFVEHNFQEVLDTLSSDGLLDRVHCSEPRPYLPENEEFADKILVHYLTCRVA